RPCDERNGYVFNDFNDQGIDSALHRAIGMWYTYPNDFQELVANGMRCDYSWNHPGQHYINIYEHIRDK
ncbi:MAG: starch synthase, partial [Verrucomicrobia bacterium]|nr:starch synthase [Verrucomicrobiota bacterium]